MDGGRQASAAPAPDGDRRAPRTPARGAVTVVGSINEDVVLRVPRSPGPGETIAAESTERLAGGKGANQAVAAARAGAAAVQMIGRVGDDDAGARMLADLRLAGVDTSTVVALADVPTGMAYITVTAKGENTIVVDAGANARLSADDVGAHADVIAAAAVMLAQLELPVATVTAAVETARRAGVRPVVTLAPAQPVPDELLHGLDPLLVNEHEAAFLLGRAVSAGAPDEAEPVRAAPEAAARRLVDLGPHSVVITLGADGAVVAEAVGAAQTPADAQSPDAGHVYRVAAREVAHVVDTTGAGDAFAGTLAAELAQGSSLREAVQAGMAAGADAVGRAGAR